MACPKPLTLSAVEGEMLEDAIFIPSLNKIIGVRGPYVKSFDPATGQLLLSNRFCQIGFGMSRLAFDSSTGKLYCCSSLEPRGDDGFIDFTFYPNQRGIWEVNPTTLAPVTNVLAAIAANIGGAVPTSDPGGAWCIIANGGKLYGILTSSGLGFNNLSDGNFVADPVTLTYSAACCTDTFFCSDIQFDGTIIWAHRPSYPAVFGFTLAHFGTVGEVFTGADYKIFNAFPKSGGVIQYAPFSSCSVGLFLYVTIRNQFVVKTLKDDAGRSYLNTGIATATPFRIRYCDPAVFPANPFAGTILIPGYASDSIIQLVADVPTNKPGFELPFDVVFTPTKAWAVQHSSTGLKEILP